MRAITCNSISYWQAHFWKEDVTCVYLRISGKLKEDHSMIQREIINKKTGEKLIMFEDDDFEYEMPVKHYGDGDVSKMPFAYEVKENGEVKTFGETDLSDGQLKQAIEHRKVKIAKILDKGNEWHCFFATFKSLRGEETWLGQKQPHYHYISNAFGIDRAEVVMQMKSEKYQLGNLPHIKLEDYGKQPEE